jgi:pimeloyl-ACP methyl ester carboxylesterase
LDNAASYDKLAPELLKIGASSVVCLDFAGHGKSDWRHSGVYYVVDHVADAVYAADALKWDKFSIIGHSLGGGVAQGVAAACLDRVLRVVSIEALSWWPQVAAFLLPPSSWT